MEAYDARLLEKAKAVCNVTDQDVVICSKVRHCMNGSKDSVIFLATEDALFLVGKNDRRRALSLQFFWHEITKVRIGKDSQIHISHNSAVTVLETRSAGRLTTKMKSYIDSVMLPSERPQFEGEIELIGEIKPVRIPCYHRFAVLLRKEGLTASPEFMKAMKRMAEVSNDYDFCQIEADPNLGALLLDSILAEPNVASVNIPRNSEKPIWPALAKLIEMNVNPNLKKICVSDIVNESFQTVTEAMISNKQCPIEEIQFTNAEWGRQRFEVLTKFVVASQIRKLTLSDSCEFEWLLQWLREITATTKHSLKSLALRNMKDIKMTELYENLGEITELALLGCIVDASLAFNALPHSHLTSLKVCDSLAQTAIHKEMCLPSSLSTLAFERITWENTTFADAWIHCIKHNPSSGCLELNFASAVVDSSLMKSFLSQIHTFGSGHIQKFVWDANPVDANLLQFLRLLPNLKSLSVSGCFFANSNTEIAEFSAFIQRNETITELFVNGINEAFVGDGIQPIFNALQQNHAVTSLSVADQRFGSAGLSALIELLSMNRIISNLVFTGNDIKDAAKIRLFFETISTRGTPVKLNSPLQMLINMSEIEKSEVALLEKLYHKITHHTNSWALPYPAIPAPDTLAITKQMSPRYTLPVLVTAFYNSQ